MQLIVPEIERFPINTGKKNLITLHKIQNFNESIYTLYIICSKFYIFFCLSENIKLFSDIKIQIIKIRLIEVEMYRKNDCTDVRKKFL